MIEVQQQKQILRALQSCISQQHDPARLEREALAKLGPWPSNLVVLCYASLRVRADTFSDEEWYLLTHLPLDQVAGFAQQMWQDFYQPSVMSSPSAMLSAIPSEEESNTFQSYLQSVMHGAGWGAQELDLRALLPMSYRLSEFLVLSKNRFTHIRCDEE